MPWISTHAAETFVADLLIASGVKSRHATIVATHLVDSDACGYPSHGLNLLISYLDDIAMGRLELSGEPTVSRLRPGALMIDGHGGFGQVACACAVAHLLSETCQVGIAIGVFRRIGHIGRLAPYVDELAKAGRIGLMVAGYALDPREAIVAPAAGASRVFGTNPIAIAAPAPSGSTVVDLATARTTVFGAIRSRRLGLPLPAGSIVDSKGDVTTDPSALFAGGAILPIEGTKGAALSLATCLVGALGNAGDLEPCIGGVAMIAIDVSAFADLSAYLTQVSKLAAALDSNNPNDAAFRLPGLRSQRARATARRNGIYIDRHLWTKLRQRARSLSVGLPPRLAARSVKHLGNDH